MRISAAAVVVAVMCPLAAVGANKFVHPGGTGTTGNDWTNAYRQLPPTLVRGDTYSSADGSYGAPTATSFARGTWLN